MANNKCAKAVLLATIAASGLAGTARAAVRQVSNHPEVALSSAVAASSPLAHLLSTATAQPRTMIDIDQGNSHIHIHERPRVGESGFDV